MSEEGLGERKGGRSIWDGCGRYAESQDFALFS